MDNKLEIIFMQVRLLRLASQEWHMSIREVNDLFTKYEVLEYIADCYDEFGAEGDYAVLEEINAMLAANGVHVNAAAN